MTIYLRVERRHSDGTMLEEYGRMVYMPSNPSQDVRTCAAVIGNDLAERLVGMAQNAFGEGR